MPKRTPHGSVKVTEDGILHGTYENTTWEVDPKGAYLTKLATPEMPLLFERTVLDGKIRGGLFPMVPQMGPDNRAWQPMPQHGYGRETQWETGHTTLAKAVLYHSQTSGPYTGLELTNVYRINRAPNRYPSLFAHLTLFNDSSREMRVAPGFHPYFDISGLAPERIREVQKDLSEAQTVPVNNARIEVAPGVEAHVETVGFEKMTFWTDGKGPYVCVEPSLAGPSFANRPYEPTDAEILGPGEVAEYSFSISWRTIKEVAMLHSQSTLRQW
jgi:glucose-6-phosphate 1-epimerase